MIEPPDQMNRVNQTAASPIYINGNVGWSSFPGVGTHGNPKRITGKIISSSTSELITIMNTNLYFIIEFCTLNNMNWDNNVDGIYLKNVQHGTIFNNTLLNNQHSIFVDVGCADILIDHNTAHHTRGTDGGGSGIRVNGSTSVGISYNTLYDHTYNGIWVDDTSDCDIAYNTIYDCETGIWTMDTEDLFRVYHNTVHDITCTAIRVGAASYVFDNEVYNSEDGILTLDTAEVYHNTIHDCEWGLRTLATTEAHFNTIYSCDWGLVSQASTEAYNNIIYDCSSGLVTQASTNAYNNVIHNCDWGVLVQDTTQAYQNTIYYNGFGILVESSDTSNEFYKNTIYQNDYGIRLTGDSSQVINNSIWGSLFGIGVDGSADNLIQGNKMFHQQLENNSYIGIRIENGSSSNYVWNNTFIGSTSYSIYIGSSDTGNDVKWNTHIKNNDGGTSQCYSNNSANSITQNFYNEWTTPDSQPDGIVDLPYILDTDLVPTPPNDPTPLTTPPTNVDVHFVAQIKVLYPNGGELINETTTIDWTDSFDTLDHAVTYDLFYSSDDGDTWHDLVLGTTETSYFWNTTSYFPKGSEYLIRVVVNCSEGEFTEDTTDSQFTVQGDTLSKPTIQNPLAENTYFQTVEISWKPSIDTWGHTVMYDLEFSNNSGSDWYMLGSDLVVTTILWDTTILTEGDDFQIRVTATCSEGVMEVTQTVGTFAIHQHALTRPVVQYPNGGEKINQSALIQWSEAVDTLSYNVYYKVEYSPDDGESWITLAKDMVDNSLEWETELVIKGESFLVRVTATSAGGPVTEDTSDDVFSLIAHTLSNPTILSPIGGQTYKDTITINWIESINSWGYHVSYSVFFTFDGINWIRLASDINETIYVWDISSIADGTEYGVKVIAHVEEGLSSFATTPAFTIQNQEITTTTTTTTVTTTTTTTGTITTGTGATNTSTAIEPEYDVMVTVGASIGGAIAIVAVIIFCIKSKPGE